MKVKQKSFLAILAARHGASIMILVIIVCRHCTITDLSWACTSWSWQMQQFLGRFHKLPLPLLNQCFRLMWFIIVSLIPWMQSSKSLLYLLMFILMWTLTPILNLLVLQCLNWLCFLAESRLVIVVRIITS